MIGWTGLVGHNTNHPRTASDKFHVERERASGGRHFLVSPLALRSLPWKLTITVGTVSGCGGGLGGVPPNGGYPLLPGSRGIRIKTSGNSTTGGIDSTRVCLRAQHSSRRLYLSRRVRSLCHLLWIEGTPDLKTSHVGDSLLIGWPRFSHHVAESNRSQFVIVT